MRTIIVNRRTRLEALVMRCVRDDRRGLARHDVARVDAGVVVHPDPSPSPDVIHETRGRRVAAREDDVAAAAAEDDGFHRSKLLRPSHGPQPSPIHPSPDRVAERFAAGDRGRDVDVELRVDVVDAAAESDLVLEVRRAFGPRVDAPAKRFRSFEATNVGVELKGVRGGVERRRVGVSGLKPRRGGRRDAPGDKVSPQGTAFTTPTRSYCMGTSAV